MKAKSTTLWARLWSIVKSTESFNFTRLIKPMHLEAIRTSGWYSWLDRTGTWSAKHVPIVTLALCLELNLTSQSTTACMLCRICRVWTKENWKLKSDHYSKQESIWLALSGIFKKTLQHRSWMIKSMNTTHSWDTTLIIYGTARA